MHAEAMLLVDDGKAEIAEGDSLLKQSMGADRNVDLALGQGAQRFRPLGRPIAAGQQGKPQPRGLGKTHHACIMLARENFGRCHQRRLAPGFDDMRHGEKRDDRLARADIALQKPQHAGGSCEILTNFGQGLRLRSRQGKGQSRSDFFGKAAFGPMRAAGALA